MAPKKPVKPPSRPVEDLEDLEGGPEDENSLPWEEDLALWEQEERQDNEWYKLILYRRLDNGRGKEKVWEWIDENPGSHAIGMQFGGGKYTAYMILPPSKETGKPRVRTRHFILASSYTERKRVQDRENGLADTYAPMGGRGPVQVSQGPSEMEKIGLIFEKMVFPMMAMMQQAHPAPAAAPMGDFKNMFSQMAGTVNQIVMESAKSSIAMNREIGREMAMLRKDAEPAAAATAGGEDDDDEADVFDWKNFLKEALQEYGPELLELTGIKKKIAAAKLMKEEVFQTLAQNKTLFTRVYDLLVKDPEVDRGQVDRVLNKMVEMGLGFNVVPAPATAVPAAPAAGTPTNGHHHAHGAAAGPAVVR